MKKRVIIFFCYLVVIFIAGCASVNKGLDKTAEGAKELGKPLGKIANVNQSISEGAVDGMMETEKAKDENPFNR